MQNMSLVNKLNFPRGLITPMFILNVLLNKLSLFDKVMGQDVITKHKFENSCGKMLTTLCAPVCQ